ncbi:MAG TPA: aminotransferase class V-fold PLP-dependent enzyme [Stellaceae bacterium]|nr:aminotransferase class V-fold PLP-dependent enzyme [Stellaceae bacterium]
MDSARSNMDIYDRLGVTKLINAQARASKIGGSLMHEEVLKAMAEAAGSFVDMSELLRKAGEHLARLIGVESVLIVNSAAAGLTVTTAACVAGRAPEKIYRLPDTEGMKNEVVVHRNQRNHYDCCVRQAGVRFVEIGSSRDTFPWELEAAISGKTAAVVYFVSHEGRNSLPLPQVLKIAHSRGVPVIVDAASELPPVSNLRKFADEGADLVIFSGGKGIGGPQASGLILGKRELVECCALNAFPNQNSIGRSMKIGKEEIAGLVTAFERFLQHDFSADLAAWERRVQTVLDMLKGAPGIETRRVFDMPEDPELHPVPIPRVWIEFRDAELQKSLVRNLQEGSPAISVRPVGKLAIALAPDSLRDGEDRIVAARIRELLAKHGGV